MEDLLHGSCLCQDRWRTHWDTLLSPALPSAGSYSAWSLVGNPLLGMRLLQFALCVALCGLQVEKAKIKIHGPSPTQHTTSDNYIRARILLGSLLNSPCGGI